MGFLARIRTLFTSNINDLISRAEDPEKMLHQVVADMKQQLGEAKKQVAGAIADEKRLKKQVADETAVATDWERKAMLAVHAGDDDLARQALKRKGAHEQSLVAYAEQWEAQKQAVEQLKVALRGLNNKIEEAKRKKGILVARKNRAEAHKAIQETMSGLNDTSAFETFERMAGKIAQLEAEAEAGTEVTGELAEAEKLRERFAELEAGDVDQKLLALKAQMGALPESDGETPKSLPEGTAKASVEDELAALKAKVAAVKKSS